MSVDSIAFRCDTPGCFAWAQTSEVASIEEAAEKVRRRSGWSTRDGEDFCGPCTREASGESG